MKLPILLLAALLAAPAGAQSLVPGPNQPGRYEMQPIQGGIARLDTVTGDVSLCRVEAGTLRCRPSEDENAATGDDDTARDETEREDLAEGRPRREPDDAAGEKDVDAEIDKAIGRLKRAFRAFNDIAREFEHERTERGPDRT